MNINAVLLANKINTEIKIKQNSKETSSLILPSSNRLITVTMAMAIIKEKYTGSNVKKGVPIAADLKKKPEGNPNAGFVEGSNMRRKHK